MQIIMENFWDSSWHTVDAQYTLAFNMWKLGRNGFRRKE